jgi:hypothetical protein
MKSRSLWWTIWIIALLPVVAGAGGRDDDHYLTRFSGLINDYTAQTEAGSPPKVVGPWEMHGAWSLTLNERSGRADFTAAMTMEEGDYFVSANDKDATLDPFTIRGPHTHHITLKGATVSYDTSTCPPDSPATTGRFMVSGPADVTANGNVAPFQAMGLSTLYVCVTGGTDVQYSNVTLQFESGSPATTHFGSQAIHGVVRKVQYDDSHDDSHH